MGLHGNAPVIIKRKKVVSGGGHHGGAWKVAYADFVTAMMAFFMLMWLLNATTEQQRKGIADYFSPTLPVNRISGGGDGMFGGDSIFTQETLAENGTGGTEAARMTAPVVLPEASPDGEQIAAQIEALEKIEEVLLGNGGESILSDQALRHVVTRLTDEGLIIEIFDLPDVPLFSADGSTPNQVTKDIAVALAGAMRTVKNGVAVTGYTASRSLMIKDNPVWDLSAARAMEMRLLLEDGGLDDRRVERVTGSADRKPVATDPMSVRNNRIEIVLLRTDF